MPTNLQEDFERCCRLCAQVQEASVTLFSEQAEAMHLENKLNKYLLIEIDEDDHLPKNICLSCLSKLQMCCEFIEFAHKAQKELAEKSLLLEQNQSKEENVSDVKVKDEIDYDDCDLVTQMEISVDPMTVLQNSESYPSPKQIESSEDVDVAYLNKEEDVTIKLIRKGSDEAQAEFSVVESNDESELKSKPFPCLICRRSFMTDIALKNHSWIHSKDETRIKKFTCQTCDKTFRHRLELVSHMKVHRIKCTCKICGRTFRSEENMKLHMDSHNSPNNAHICKICGRSYDKISNLKTHSVTHCNDRPFNCHLCKKSFKRNQDLKFHINQHTGARPYQCPFCDKRFASSGNCYSHRSRMHPGRKAKKRVQPEAASLIQLKAGMYKYQCNLCSCYFMRLDNYTYHMFQHTGQKPFQCKYCTEQFVTRKGLYLHHSKEHPGQQNYLGLISKNALLK